MQKQPVNIRPFLYNYLSRHPTYSALADFLLDLYSGMARAGGMYRSFSWSEIESIIEDFTDEDLKYFDPVLSRLFDGVDVIGVREVENVFEFYAAQLLQVDVRMNIEDKKQFAMI